MFIQPILNLVQEQAPAHAGQAVEKPFDAGETIISHIANSSPEHPLVHLPPIFGIDMSISKHVFMVWLVAALVFTVITVLVRRYIRQPRLVPTGAMNVIEVGVEFIRDGVVGPAIGPKWTNTWLPLLLTLFVFILSANLIGLIPIFETLGLIDHYLLHTPEHSFMQRLIHGGTTATGNYNVTAALAVITFFSIIIAGSRSHGVLGHWKNYIPHGVPWPLYFLLIPLELLGMFVRPFALTMRLAANMMGGHVALLAVLSFVFIFTTTFDTWVAGVGVGLGLSLPLAVGLSGLEMIVVLVQAYVFTLLSAVFIGMAIQSHH